uniref:Uncharacterized protein n=1 Tax=Babesia bovis TaxID=5865 RepID=S6AZZ9_BABBO|nr:conserved hypothetical protein [Babesia bovis]
MVHQTSIPAHTTTNFCNFANYIPTTESFSTVVPSCFSTCYPRVISNPADSMVTMRSIPTQPSIPMAATDVNCFNSCFGYNTNPLTSYQTQGTFGLRNLFTMNPYGQPAVPVDTLSRQLSSVSLQPSINDNSGVVHTAASQLLSAPPLIVQEPTVSERVYKKSNMKPKTFKLHAVEVHQFVPMPQNPTSPFVQTVSGMNYLGQPIYRHGVGIEHPNAFFNPNTTGYIAPVMRDVIDGVENPKIPHMYSMDSQRSHQVVRLETEESRISPRDRVDTTDMEPAENVKTKTRKMLQLK